MLSFAVFENGAPAADWPLRHAHLVGPEDAPLAADIRLSEGLIRCTKKSADAAALCVQFPVDPAEGDRPGESGGLLTLQTCLLPPREAPYLLPLELARHRLMLTINKLEDWALFDLAESDEAVRRFEEARHALTEAMVAAGSKGPGAGRAPFTAEADRLARRALASAVKAGETLALRQARAQHGRRASGELAAAAAAFKPPANAVTEHETRESRNAFIGSVGVILTGQPQVGVAIGPDCHSPTLQALVQGSCDFITMPMRWVDMEPTEGKYAFTKTDRWIEWAVRTAKVPVVGGPVIDFRPRCVPEWLYIWEHDYDTLRELVYEHVKNIVTRYRRTVSTWTVVSGLNANRAFSLTIEQVMDLTRICVLLVRKLQPGASVQVEIDQPWGESAAETARSVDPMLYAEMTNQIGLNIDAFALRVQMGRPESGRSARDLMALSAVLDRYAALDKPISISAMSVPARPADLASGAGSENDPGYWHAPWTEDVQAEWLASAASVAASKPYVQSLCWHELCDGGGDAIHDGLLTAQGVPRRAMARLAEVRRALREGRFPLAAAPAGAPAPAAR